MSRNHLLQDARIDDIRRRLPDWSESGVAPPPEGFREAAVSLIVRASDSPDILLIKRSKSERDPWSGQMALPGGRRDPIDTSLVHTAMRETLEETGLRLSESAVLGRLDVAAPVNRVLPKLAVTPIVFGVDAGASAIVNSYEVASVHWVSLEELRDPASSAITTIDVPGGAREFPIFRVDGQTVWGLTHRILTHFLEQVAD